MQNGHTPNALINEDGQNVTRAISNDNDGSHLSSSVDRRSNSSNTVNQSAFETNHQESEQRGKKRKLVEIGLVKPPSPPWRKFEAEGPTSFVAEGRRKSGRTNALPLDKLPQGQKRQTRRAQQEYESRRRGISDPINLEKSPSHNVQKGTPNRRVDDPKSSVVSKGFQSNVNLHKTKRSRESKENDFHHVHSKPRALTINGNRSHNSKSHSKTSRTQQSHTTTPDNKLHTRKTTQDNTATPNSGLRLRLRFHRPHMTVRNPYNIPAKPKFESLQEFLDQDDPFEGEEAIPPRTRETIVREAFARDRIVDAAKPGGPLSEDGFLGSELDPSRPPPPQYSHPDYMLKHVVDLRQRMQREQQQHKIQAKKFAFEALERWRFKQPKTAEQKAEEERAAIIGRRKAIHKQLHDLFKTQEEKYKQDKLKEYQASEEIKDKQHLQRLLDNSQRMLIGRKKRLSLPTSAEDTATDGDSVEDDSASLDSNEDENDDDDDNFSSSSSGSSNENLVDAGDDHLTVEELRQKYAAMSGVPDDGSEDNGSLTKTDVEDEDGSQSYASNQESPEPEFEPFVKQINPAEHPLEEVSDALLDDTDASGSTSGTEYSSSEDEEDDEEISQLDSNEESDGDDGRATLMGFLSKSQRDAYTKPKPPDADDLEIKVTEEMRQQNDGQLNQAGEADTVMTDAWDLKQKQGLLAEPQTPGVVSTSGEPSHHEYPSSNATPKENVLDSMSSVHSSDGQDLAVEEDLPQITVPSLMRGQLRLYQHKGLDWLAGMYAKSTNGILADEMGLGKTIQTIALLAHLATHHEIWGPHLIVVPTSVMLNWEMEFKKFCPGFKILTYYGSQEERKAKRKGWMDDDRWHVCITSYQLAIVDAASLKRRNWHFLILDEAHNIKNFRSQRWQTLLGFRSQARLLLTGTPLQNNLAELWSLLFFLAPEENLEGETSFGDLTKFSKTFRRPVEQILDSGQEGLDDEARDVVMKLHNVLRPHLLRRLKSEVEKQMPKKYEHVTICRLSKRQRQLYDGYMSLAGTRDSFASGNYMSIINCLMQLRKVCNHPDLFETRQIVTSFAMSKSVTASYEIKELLIRRRTLQSESQQLDALNLWTSNTSSIESSSVRKLSAQNELQKLIERLKQNISDYQAYDAPSLCSSRLQLDKALKTTRLSKLTSQMELTKMRTSRRPLYGRNLLERLDCSIQMYPLAPHPKRIKNLTDAYLSRSTYLDKMILPLPQRAKSMDITVQKFGCITPIVTAPGLARQTLTPSITSLLQQQSAADIRHQAQTDPYHEARVRLSIAFPDKTLIQYDCGKLQKLAVLLRELQSNGHRALIFTQMTKVLDILEQFLNLHGHRYLRLDGSTRIEQRQVLTERFNSDPRILAFILSSRSGGLGINLTGADTVIFYDLDWNPAMDKQCQDRCHRIGQTRDVHIYRFVSEGTIEANILRKSNQKRILDDIVIQQGEFTTEYFDQLEIPNRNEDDAKADEALEKILGGGQRQVDKELVTVEDKEDQDAAKFAQKEEGQVDDADFGADKPSSGSGTPKEDTEGSPTPLNPVQRLHRQSMGGALPSSPLAQTPMTPNIPTPTAPSRADYKYEPLPPVSGDLGDLSSGLTQDKLCPFPLVSLDEEAPPVTNPIYRFFEYAYAGVTILPPSERSRKKAKKGKNGGVPIIRR